ncbi:MAG: ABC transporter ATP-binding protein/permease [Burkholderiaceae bacterium]
MASKAGSNAASIATPRAAGGAARGLWPSFWQIARPYWVSEERWIGGGLFVVLIALSLALVWVSVRLNTWNGHFYNALEDKDYPAFKRLLLEFTWIAFLYIVLAVYQLYLQQMLTMRWRRWLTDVHLANWMRDAIHYRLSLADFGSDNPDQRIAEDLRDFVSLSLSLFFGLLSSVVTLLSFIGILWSLSGSMTLAGIEIPGYMVWIALVYAGLGSVVAHAVGKPLIGLNFQQERFEADFRFALVRARENAEGIALYHGEHDELAGFRQRFGRVVANWWQIMKRQKRYMWFSSFYGQLAIIFPFVVAAPRYFSGAIALGALMQTSEAFGKVQESLSWLVDSYTTLADWRAAIARLDGFSRAIEAARALAPMAPDRAPADASEAPAAGPASVGAASVGSASVGSMSVGAASVDLPVAGSPAADPCARIDLGYALVAVPVASPSSHAQPADAATPGWHDTPMPAIVTRPLLQTDHQRIEPGQHTLIVGPSGTGKSTLFRLLAGIWPFADGDVTRLPVDEALFLPQRPYLPLGSLRDALCYPRQTRAASDAAIADALSAAGLPSLVARLDETANWTQVLSGGEQQRLAAARALLIAPRWLLLDEATSALDERGEQAIYQALRDRLPRTTMVSIAHRPSVARFHRQVLRVEPRDDGPAVLRLAPLPAAGG